MIINLAQGPTLSISIEPMTLRPFRRFLENFFFWCGSHFLLLESYIFFRKLILILRCHSATAPRKLSRITTRTWARPCKGRSWSSQALTFDSKVGLYVSISLSLSLSLCACHCFTVLVTVSLCLSISLWVCHCLTVFVTITLCLLLSH